MENFKQARIFDAGGDLDNRWFVFYYFRDPDTSKFRRFREWIPQTIRSASGRRDHAHGIIKRINTKLKTGFNPFSYKDKKATNILAAMNYVLEQKKRSCRPRTYHTYNYLVNLFFEFLARNNYSGMPVEDFNSGHAQEFINFVRKKRKIANRTHNYMVMHMKTFFNLLISQEWIMVNPFHKITRLATEEPEIVSFTKAELKVLQEHLPGDNRDLYFIACMIFYCFLRPAEIMRLRISHIDVAGMRIIVPGSVSKNKKHETILIPKPFQEIVKKFDLNWPGDYYIFTRGLKRGQKPAAPTRIAGYWREWANDHGIEKNIYSLKHTGVGMAIEAGINVRDLQLQLRHSSLEMTQVYLDKFKRRSSDKLINDFPSL